MANQETYSIDDDTLNSALAATQLREEIDENGTIGPLLDYVTSSGDLLSIHFTQALIASEVTILDGIVAAHAGVAIEDDESLRHVLIVKDSSKGGTTYLSHNVYAMGPSATNTIEWQIHTPSSWNQEQDPKIHFVGLFNLAGSLDPIVYEYAIERTSDGEIIDGVDDVVMNYTELIPDTANKLYYSTKKTINSSSLGLKSNDHLRVTFRRIGGDAADTRPGDLKLLHLMVIWPLKSGGITT